MVPVDRRDARRAELEGFDARLRREHDVSRLAGVDEVGRGPLAGPVVAAAVILPPGAPLPGVDDSKRLTPGARERVYDVIRQVAVAYAWAVVTPAVIDRINILEASRLAMRRALAGLGTAPELVVVDGWEVPRLGWRQVARPRADASSLAVAAASVLAKVRRDRMMARYSRVYPLYDFAGNKGYPTPEHLEALRVHGPCAIHRRSFGPVAQIGLGL